MVEWAILKIESTADYDTINKAFVRQTSETNPERNSSKYRRIYVTYKEALRQAAKDNAVKAGKRPEDLDFNFSDDRYLDEFMSILNTVCTSTLKSSTDVWKSFIEDADYRTLQRTEAFITEFDRYMSKIVGLEPYIWKYLINHFKVYGFAAQNKKLISNLQKYSGLSPDVLISAKSAVYGVVQTQPQTKKSAQAHADKPQVPKKPQASVQQMKATAPVPPQTASTAGKSDSSLRNNSFDMSDPVLVRYLDMQDSAITDKWATEFFMRLDRVYSHDITKNNLSAWRYLMSEPNYLKLFRQVRFVEKLVSRLQHVDDLYPAVWEYIIDRTQVPKNHPMYGKTTGRLIQLMNEHKYTGTISQQTVLSTDLLYSIIIVDDYTPGHHDYKKQEQQSRHQQYQKNLAKVNKNNKNNKNAIIILIIFIIIVLRMIFDI